MSQSPKDIIENHAAVIRQTARGYVTPYVVDAKSGKVVWEGPRQANLIMDAGLNALLAGNPPSGNNTFWLRQILFCSAGTGNTPTKDLPDGTYTQSEDTVTRFAGTFDFTSEMVGRLIYFSSGEQGRITEFVDAANVKIERSQTVPKLKKPIAITAAASTVSDFTITAPGHGFKAGDRVTISGMTPSDYNGTWLIDEVPDADTFTVIDSSNPGSGSGFGEVVLHSAKIIIYRVNQTSLANFVKSTNTYPSFTQPEGGSSQANVWDESTKSYIRRKTYDFSEETGPVNYTECCFSRVAHGEAGFAMFSRVLFLGSVTVLAGQLLRVKYELVFPPTSKKTSELPVIETPLAGMPFPYNISSITSDESSFTVTTSENHHYLAGGKINLSGVKKPRTAITAAASTVSDFTITAPGHGFKAGDIIVIEGVTPSGYNGVWTVDSVAGDDIIVSSAVNPGTGTDFGNVREQEPQATAITGIASTWDDFTITAPGHGLSGGETIVVRDVTPSEYNGEYEVDSVSGDDLIIVDTRNLGAGTGGTIHEKGKLWYDDEWIIDSVGSNTITCLSTLNLGAAGPEGLAFNNVRRKFVMNHFGISASETDTNVAANRFTCAMMLSRADTSGGYSIAASLEASKLGSTCFIAQGDQTKRNIQEMWPCATNSDDTIAQYITEDPVNFPNETYNVGAIGETRSIATSAYENYVPGSFRRKRVFTFGAGIANYNRFFAIRFGDLLLNNSGHMGIFFEEPQIKKSTHRLVVELTLEVDRDLSIEAN